MKKIAEILDGKVWRTFEAEDSHEFIKNSNSRLQFVDITGLSEPPEDGYDYVDGAFTKPAKGNLRKKVLARREAMLAREAHRFETAMCHFMMGALDAEDRGYLTWREMLRQLDTDDTFNHKNPEWPDLKTEIEKERLK